MNKNYFTCPRCGTIHDCDCDPQPHLRTASDSLGSMDSVGPLTYLPTPPRSEPSKEPPNVKMAQQNFDRMLVHLPDDQICGIWPDGSSIRGAHIKHLLSEERGEYMRASSSQSEPPTWQPIETLPTTMHETELFFRVVPKLPEESWVDTSGKSIFTTFEPKLHRGRFGTWNSLSKATHWHPMLELPEVS